MSKEMACSKVSRRLPFFDNLKGVLIALVVVGHFFNGALSAQIVPAWCLFDFIYSFHMPLFIFVSGMFCKSAYSQKKGFRAGLVLYYLLLSWMMYLALWLPQAFLGVAEPLNLLTLDGSMPWYLMALAVYCALTPLFSALKPSFAIVAACGLAVLSGFVDVGNVFSASRVIVFSPFFLIGYYLRSDSVAGFISDFQKKVPMARVLAVVLLAAVLVAFQSFDLGQLRMSQSIFRGSDSYSHAMAYLEGSSLLACCLVRIGGFALTALVGLCLMLLVPQTEAPVLSRVGRHTLQVYIFHAFVSYLLSYTGIVLVLYESLAAPLAGAAIVALGVVVSVVLGWPDVIQRGFDHLKRAVDRLTA